MYKNKAKAVPMPLESLSADKMSMILIYTGTLTAL